MLEAIAIATKLSKSITAVFMLVFNQIDNRNNQLRYVLEISTFWNIWEKQPVTKAIDNIKGQATPTPILSFDLSIL